MGEIMNISTIAIALIAWQLLRNNNPKNNKGVDLGGISNFLSPDAKDIVDNIGTLTNGSGDKTSAILSLITNPSVMSFADSMFGKGKTQPSAPEPTASSTNDNTDSGYNYPEGTEEARQFFAPIESVAGKEVSSKLYQMYDNWYSKKRL